jgi:hypothetical protein
LETYYSNPRRLGEPSEVSIKGADEVRARSGIVAPLD